MDVLVWQGARKPHSALCNDEQRSQADKDAASYPSHSLKRGTSLQQDPVKIGRLFFNVPSKNQATLSPILQHPLRPSKS